MSTYAALEQEKHIEVRVDEVTLSGGDVDYISFSRGKPVKEPCAIHSSPDEAREHQ